MQVGDAAGIHSFSSAFFQFFFCKNLSLRILVTYPKKLFDSITGTRWIKKKRIYVLVRIPDIEILTINWSIFFWKMREKKNQKVWFKGASAWHTEISVCHSLRPPNLLTFCSFEGGVAWINPETFLQLSKFWNSKTFILLCRYAVN